MNAKIQHVHDCLKKESARYTDLAKDLALELLKDPTCLGAECKKRKGQDHLVRAETFNVAAQIVAVNGF